VIASTTHGRLAASARSQALPTSSGRRCSGSTVDSSYVALFSKDRAQAFVMHPSRTIPVSKLKFRFSYIEWDGSDYVDHSVVTTGFVPTII